MSGVVIALAPDCRSRARGVARDAIPGLRRGYYPGGEGRARPPYTGRHRRNAPIRPRRPGCGEGVSCRPQPPLCSTRRAAAPSSSDSATGTGLQGFRADARRLRRPGRLQRVPQRLQPRHRAAAAPAQPRGGHRRGPDPQLRRDVGHAGRVRPGRPRLRDQRRRRAPGPRVGRRLHRAGRAPALGGGVDGAGHQAAHAGPDRLRRALGRPTASRRAACSTRAWTCCWSRPSTTCCRARPRSSARRTPSPRPAARPRSSSP